MKEYQIQGEIIGVSPNNLGFSINFRGKENQVITEYLQDDEKEEHLKYGQAVYLSQTIKEYEFINEADLPLLREAIEKAVNDVEPNFFQEFS